MEKITQEELKNLYYQDDLSDNEIARKFNVSVSKVKYKRKKFGVTYIDKLCERFSSESHEQLAHLNIESKTRLCQDENISWITKSIVYHIFRNGPVERLHEKGQLSQEDMMILNKNMVDQLGMIISAAVHGNWLILEEWLSYYKQWGGNWDDPALTDKDMQRLVLKNALKSTNDK